MATTVMSNRRSEPQPNYRDQDGWDAGRCSTPPIKRESDDAQRPSHAYLATPQTGRKRSLESAGFEDDWGLNDGDDDLLRVADSFETSQAHKAQKTGVYATPTTGNRSSRKLPWLEQMKSPPSSAKPYDQHLATPSKPPSKGPENARIHNETPELQSSSSTLRPPDSPSPQARYKDALVDPADSGSSLTNEVLAYLASSRLPPEKMSTLRTILSRHDLKAQGVAKGRDISRLALKAKQAKIVELQYKISRLEAEKEVDRGVIQKLRWDRQHSQETEDDNDELL